MTPHNFLRGLEKIRNPKTILNGKESVYFPILPSYFFFFYLNCIALVHLIVPGRTLQYVSHGIFSILRMGISQKSLNLVFESGCLHTECVQYFKPSPNKMKNNHIRGIFYLMFLRRQTNYITKSTPIIIAMQTKH